MKIIILTQYYPPEIGAPQRRLSELAERMADAGHSVTVMTAMPNYPRGKIYEGYSGLIRQENMNGVEIIRTIIFPTQKTSFIHRLSNYFSFVLSSAFIGAFLLPKADYLLVESPPLFLGLSGIWLSWLKKSRLIFNVSDLWPESAVQLGIVRQDSQIHKLSLWLENLCYRSAWLISGQSKGILNDIQSRFPSSNTFHLSNGVDTSKFGEKYANSDLVKELRAGSNCVAVYAGLHGLAQGLDQIIEAAARLHGEDGLRFILVGDGPEKQALIKDVAARQITNVQFWDPIPAEKVPSLLASADIILITLKSYISGAVPSKLYEAMASGKPVVIVAAGEPAEIVIDNRAGIAVEPQDIESLANAIRQLFNNSDLRRELALNGRKTAEESYNREQIVGRFVEYLEKHNS